MIVSSFRRYIHNGFSETHANQIKSSQDTSQTEDLRRRNEKAADKKPTKEEEKGSRIEYKKITYRIAHNMSKNINTHTKQKKKFNPFNAVGIGKWLNWRERHRKLK